MEDAGAVRFRPQKIPPHFAFIRKMNRFIDAEHQKGVGHLFASRNTALLALL
jgi:hypothetical protein